MAFDKSLTQQRSALLGTMGTQRKVRVCGRAQRSPVPNVAANRAYGCAKGLLLGLFFITVGAGINYKLFLAEPGDVIGLALLVILAKGTVLYFVGKAFGLKRRNHWLTACGKSSSRCASSAITTATG